MAVLITGGAGYIGSHMALALRDAGEAAVVLDDLSAGFREAVPAETPLVVGDIADEALLRRTVAAHRIDAVAHFAGKIVAPESVRDPLATYFVNTSKTQMMLRALISAGVRKLIFSSTAAVYGLNPPTPTGEDAATDPASPYAASKLMAERMIRDVAAAHGLAHVTLRYFNVAGADPALRAGQRAPGASNLITLAARAALGLNEGLQIFGVDLPTPDGTGVRDYIHVSDLAAAHVAALRHLRAGGESLTLNCGYGWGYSVREVIEAVRRMSGRPLPVEERPARAGDPYVSVADASRIRDLLGWKPERADLDVIVADALRWETRMWVGGPGLTASAKQRA